MREFLHDLVISLFATANCLSESLPVLSFVHTTFPLFLLVALEEMVHMCRNTFLLQCVCSLQTSQRHTVDDNDLDNVSMSLLTVQLHCAFVYLCSLFLILKNFLLLAHLCLDIADIKLTRTPDEIKLFSTCSWSSNRSPDARTSAWIASACGATSGLSHKIV